MKSPFPGMDPYLEKFWSDVHLSLMFLIRSQIQKQLPEGLRSSVEESVRIDINDPQSFVSDVAVTARNPWDGTFAPDSSYSGSFAVAEPVVVAQENVPERHIEIVSTKTDHEVVTAIEVLSPTNRLGENGRSKYLTKRKKHLLTDVNFVEIDLLRGGRPLPEPFEDPLDRYAPKTFLAWVNRAFWQQWEIYPIGLRERLPAFRIPLRPSDTDVVVDLQAAIDQAYEEGAYSEAIDYSVPPEPAFEEEADLEWLKQLAAPE